MEHPPPREAEVAWRDGDVPVSRRYGEAYFGDADALAEKRHVFIAGNALPRRFRCPTAGIDGGGPPFQIAELGFGTGLGALAAALEWRAAGRLGKLRYAAFEAHPIPAGDMARALRPWPELEPFTGQMVDAWAAGARAFTLRDEAAPASDVVIEVIEGDARETLPRWQGCADAWFLDGFSPARNPELWEPGLLAEVAAKSRPGASLATYSAAAGPRAALEAAGFRVERLPGFGRKKHMTKAHLPASGPSEAGRASGT